MIISVRKIIEHFKEFFFTYDMESNFLYYFNDLMFLYNFYGLQIKMNVRKKDTTANQEDIVQIYLELTNASAVKEVTSSTAPSIV